jgi:hypothetical protein
MKQSSGVTGQKIVALLVETSRRDAGSHDFQWPFAGGVIRTGSLRLTNKNACSSPDFDQAFYFQRNQCFPDGRARTLSC